MNEKDENRNYIAYVNSHSLSIPDRTNSNGNPINVCFEIEYKFSGVGIKSGTFEIIPVPAL